MELASTVPAAFYPDLVQARGLAPVVQAALEELRSPLEARQLGKVGVVCAAVEAGPRSCEICIATRQRMFVAQFWARGVMLAEGDTPDPREMARAIDAWVAAEWAAAQLAAVFAWVTVDPRAAVYESGGEVEEAWAHLRNDDMYPQLIPFAEAAYRRPELRRLFPFTSMDRFHFSRCTGYPFTRDTPYVHFMGDGYWVRHMRAEILLGSGSAEEAAGLVSANLPPGCGAAVAGTADDLPPATEPAEPWPVIAWTTREPWRSLNAGAGTGTSKTHFKAAARMHRDTTQRPDGSRALDPLVDLRAMGQVAGSILLHNPCRDPDKAGFLARILVAVLEHYQVQIGVAPEALPPDALARYPDPQQARLAIQPLVAPIAARHGLAAEGGAYAAAIATAMLAITAVARGFERDKAVALAVTGFVEGLRARNARQPPSIG